MLWSIQNRLLAEAEQCLGPTDPNQTIWRPIFSQDNPHIIVLSTENAAQAVLSPSAAGFWPTTVYELAHETVHLLNPIKGKAAVLEEGVAQTFALKMGDVLGGFKQSSPEYYKMACDAVALLGPDILASGKLVRDKCGSLSPVSISTLEELFPDAERDLLEMLIKRI